MPVPRTKKDYPEVSLRDTMRCPKCKSWIESRRGRGRLDTHIRAEHPETALEQVAYVRDLLGLKEGESLPVTQTETIQPTKAPTFCVCGCGEATKSGGKFAMGHDARLDGKISRWVKGLDPKFPLAIDVAASLLPEFHKGKYASLANEQGRKSAQTEIDAANEQKIATQVAKEQERAAAKAASEEAKALKRAESEAKAAAKEQVPEAVTA